ncbi:preprotein translocase subunit SecE [Aliivibrio salmonicida]|uniref:Protein translocase subunit SecE n=1 Tax=Aliivibrio salmonicida (strain LFI1238) TaxID=316275 RepID=B6ENR9_ALISL|nr:preprotein translocase subunit SecE [Aliivibrio salmonicida]AZL85948.1 preprotein translocase subunit SecE [Aliivibrio salmonicida]CAQ80556.1 preprotein translocase sece subunit [Aliivibrio salmonicida LFI1238]
MKTNTETTETSGAVDTIKWLLVLVLLSAAVIGNYLLADLSVVIRAAGVVALIAAAGGIAAFTAKGQTAIEFARESRMEVRKVVWPTRQETTQTTFIVLAVCIVMALILWGIDGIMVRLIGLITGV